MPDVVPLPPPSTTGTADFRGWSTWYRVTGDLEATRAAGLSPLVVLHGGPGAAHDYTLRIARAAERGRAVVHYDQVGCGRSTHLRDAPTDLWTVQLFLDELDTLLAHLGIADRYAVLGQSWGGVLGAEHAVRRPAGLTALVIADAPASIDLWVSEANRLREDLPPDVQATLLAHEAAGTTDSAEYHAAAQVYYDRHVCRIVPNPPEVMATDAYLADDPTVYEAMNGPSEFHCIGSMREWTVVDRLPRISVPTLVVTGAYDEATPATVQPFLEHVPDVRWELFADSSHLPHVEEEERYLQVVGDFLDAVDAGPARTSPDRTPHDRSHAA